MGTEKEEEAEKEVGGAEAEKVDCGRWNLTKVRKILIQKFKKIRKERRKLVFD